MLFVKMSFFNVLSKKVFMFRFIYLIFIRKEKMYETILVNLWYIKMGFISNIYGLVMECTRS